MNIITKVLVTICIAVTVFLTGCYSWEPGWKAVNGPAQIGNVDAIINKANLQIASADNKEKLEELIGTYERVLEIDPHNYEALWSLGRYYILIGVAYSDDVKVKQDYYLKAIHACERGMYTNKDFKKLVDSGKPVWEACSVLTIQEIEAMNYWYTALGMIYVECLNPLEKVINLHWIARNKKVLDRMMAIDPAWGGGHPYAAMGAYYASIPRIFGGDLKKSSEYYEKADATGVGWLYVRFFRAKFLYAKTKDRDAYKNDLEWVVAHDPHTAKSPYPWNVYFQREAKKMLTEISVEK